MKIGRQYFIRTITYHYTGRVIAETELAYELADAAWIADSGRFATALKTGELSEVEPYPDSVSVMKGAIVDYCEWTHPLPRQQK